MKIRRNFNVDLDKYVIMQEISNPEETFIAFTMADHNTINAILKSENKRELESEIDGFLITFNCENNILEGKVDKMQMIRSQIKNLKGIWLLPPP